MKTLFTITLIWIAASSFTTKSFATGLTNEEKEGIQLMREEEKLAHDVYIFLYDKWNMRIFSNISNAESRHFEAIGYLIDNYELEDQAKEGAGNFNNKELQELYNSLTEKGSKSLTAALEVGALIEEVDIADLQKLLAANPDSIITGVYQNLLRGSENHLRAFTGQLENQNVKYTPTILSETAYTKIIEGSHQKGDPNSCVLPNNNCPNKNNQGRNRHRGHGKGRKCGQNGWN
jgi:hypothetical protein